MFKRKTFGIVGIETPNPLMLEYGNLLAEK